MSRRVKKQRRGDTATKRGGDSIRPVAPSPRRRVAPSPRRPVSGFDKVFEKIYRLVLRIPRGRVMTYGQIARILEERYSPRLVGWAMHATPKDARNIPWHRVINSRGGISTGRVILTEPDVQRLLLEAEGVVFDARGHCDLSVYQWSPRQRATRAKLKAMRAKATPRGIRKTKPKER
jgi:methylated-DNA-protein-cysteine methyltransferase-like protein